MKDDDDVDGPRKSPDSGKSCVYISSSPDEVALVEGVQRYVSDCMRVWDQMRGMCRSGFLVFFNPTMDTYWKDPGSAPCAWDVCQGVAEQVLPLCSVFP